MQRAIESTKHRRRARLHAALGEPVRLAIADALALSDRAPNELAEMFDMPTNLLAHHVGVMEQAGLVTRRRSEGDGRRTYIQLRLDDPLVDALVGIVDQRTSSRSRRVVFVCTHNSARSQLAAAAWDRISHFPVASAGTHPAPRVHRRAVSVGRRHELALSGHPTAHVNDVVRHDDLVVAVCDQAHEELGATGRADSLHWSVPDPVRLDTDDAFETAFVEISARVERLARAIPQTPRVP